MQIFFIRVGQSKEQILGLKYKRFLSGHDKEQILGLKYERFKKNQNRIKQCVYVRTIIKSDWYQDRTKYVRTIRLKKQTFYFISFLFIPLILS